MRTDLVAVSGFTQSVSHTLCRADRNTTLEIRPNLLDLPGLSDCPDTVGDFELLRSWDNDTALRPPPPPPRVVN